MANGSTIPEVDAHYAEHGRVPPLVPRAGAPFDPLAELRAEVAELRGVVEQLAQGVEQLVAGQQATAAVIAPAAVELATTIGDVKRLGPIGWARVQRRARRADARSD